MIASSLSNKSKKSSRVGPALNLLIRKWIPLTLTTFLLGFLGSLIFSKFQIGNAKFILAITTMVFAILGWIADRKAIPWLKIVATVLIAALAVMVVQMINHNSVRGTLVNKIHGWNMFHYVLASKYFDELGYFNLYYGALLADADNKNYYSKVTEIRDMEDYRRIPIKTAFAKAKDRKVKERFSQRRWQEFKKDLARILPLYSNKIWQMILNDRGFNPSPVWLVAHYPLLNNFNLGQKHALKKLATIQVWIFVLTFLVAWWGFGLRTTCLMTIWLNLYFGNEGRLLGGYFPYDWFALIIVAAALYKKGRYILSAPFLAYSAMMRGFPGLMALAAAVKWVWQLVKTRRPETRHTVFLSVLVFFCLALVLLSFGTKRGAGAWVEWKDKIQIHSAHQNFSSARVGLNYLFSHNYISKSLKVWKYSKKDLRAKTNTIFRITQGIFLFLILLAMIRRDDYDGMLLGFAAVFAIMLLSRYYISFAVLFFTWNSLDKRKIGNLLSILWLFALVALFYWQMEYGSKNIKNAYFTFNFGLTLYFVAVGANFLIRDLWAVVKGKKGGLNKSRKPNNSPASA